MSTSTLQEQELGMLPGLRDALRGLVSADTCEARQVTDTEVTDGLALVGSLRQLLDVAEVALVREGLSRGLPSEASWSPTDWVGVTEGLRAPRPPVRHTASVVRVAEAGLSTREPLPDGQADVADVTAVFADGELPLGKADQLVRFHEGVAPVADTEVLADELATLLESAKDHLVASGPDGRSQVRVPGLDEKKLATAIARATRRITPPEDVEDLDERQKVARSLSSAPGPCGMTRYTAVLDPEGAAVLDAALAALSGPVPGPDGQPDERPPARRRADALIEVIRRGVASPAEVTTNPKAQVVVTIALAALASQHGGCAACGRTRGPGAGAGAGGLTATGQVLSPAVVRTMACEAGIIPAVLGSDGELLDLGRSTRLFSPGQRRALWLRDGGCTFPGCTMPPQWTDAHHVQWWSRGGTTDIANAALLCQRHHTRVHAQDLSATIAATGVTWHL